MFKPGKVYRRRSIHEKYGGQNQSGISTPRSFPFIMIFTGDSGEEYGYKDGWQDNGVFYYTGEGQEGDMNFNKGNKAIRDHVENGKDIYLFEYVKTGHVEFIDNMTCIGYHNRRSTDRLGHMRETIVFELVRTEELTEGVEEEINGEINNDSLSELRKKAVDSAEEEVTVTERVTKSVKRSKAIKLYALKRAKGICEACDTEAPFYTKEGQPFLEVHHLRRLSDGGPDHPESVGAICPNCHRRCHHGRDFKEYNAMLVEVVRNKEMNL
ncbi:HNH endonuclease [Evansella clarkii]|uniref:HNH endonuclease n=1 Tax=Evansella clarkii TaxID=79879 RepID=UPI000996679C|nr:HNH endonuclease [Evansella clarkii]